MSGDVTWAISFCGRGWLILSPNLYLVFPMYSRSHSQVNKYTLLLLSVIDKTSLLVVGNSKFECIGGADDHDRTNLNEKALPAFLLRQYKSNKISKSFYQRIPPTGSTRRRIYGLPKVHKPQPIPLRPIFSMIGSPQHQMANWLAEILQPVLDKYASHVIKDSFEFADLIRDHPTNEQTETFMCSFNVVSLFTGVPIDA